MIRDFRLAGLRRVAAWLVLVAVLEMIAAPLRAAPPYGDGPGGPILVVTNAASPVSLYYAEILLTEGLNAFAFADVNVLAASLLTNYDAVILAGTPLSGGQVTTLSNWVVGGGNLLALRPDKKLAGLLGLTDAGGTVAEGYLQIATNTAPCAGLTGDTIQFHGTADRYTLSGATSLATLYLNATNATAHPAVTWRSVGVAGGHAGAFTFELAQSVFLTRQGNPAWVDQNRDGDVLIRSDDLFFGATTNAAYGPPTNDWVNLAKVPIPQADEQQRLFAKLLVAMTLDRKPLPRFWYFPRGHKAVVVMTGDDHAYGTGGTKGRFDYYNSISPPGASVEDWEAVRGTSYVFPSAVSLTAGQAAAFEAQGFEIGVHVDTGCANYSSNALWGFFTNQIRLFQQTFPAVPAPTTERVHCIPWSGYTWLPEVQLARGIRFDVNYYHYPPFWIGSAVQGFMTGSGMPMRFCRTNGAVLDIYQAPTQMTDESGQSFPATINQLLDGALGAEGYYGAFVANMHTDFPGSTGSDAIVASARARGVPVVSARQMLRWIDGRNASKFQDLVWSNNVLGFSVVTTTNARGLRCMVPVAAGMTVTSLTSNAVAIPWTMRIAKGVNYAEWPAFNASYQIGIIPDVVPPAITSTTPTNTETGVATASVVKAVFSEQLNPASVTTNNFRLRLTGGNFVPVTLAYDDAKREVTLTPTNALAIATSYTAFISGATDLAGLTMTGTSQWAFVTVPQPQWSIWAGQSVSPQTDPDTNSVELGVKFRSSSAGYVTALRFYKLPTLTGTHFGSLWTSNGVNLASVTFSNETASGWQQQSLPAPVAIASNTTYVASYRVPNGGYAVTSQYFNGKGATNGPVRALVDGEQGGNGLYRYPSGFPTNSYQSENYWVDVLFQQFPASNSPPVFVVTPPNVTLAELTALVVTNAALDADVPAQTLGYSLLNPPLGASISTNGVITWTPSEVQGPSTNQLVTVASDGVVSVTNSFQVIVTEVNLVPAFAGTPTNRTIAELTLLTVTNAATDADFPGQLLTYSLLAPPSGASISTNGVITWTPTEAQGPSTNQLVAIVSDGMVSVTNSFQVIVSEVNLAPAFAGASTNRTIPELTLLTVTNAASDSDLPAQVLTYSLLNPPSGVVISTNGVITWTPSEAQGPSTNQLVTVVSDGMASVTNSFQVIVTEVNLAPAFTGTPTNRMIPEFALLTVTNAATDADIPAQPLSYSLLNPPAGVAISTNGVITWAPTEAQGPSTNQLVTVVTDGLVSVTNSFQVIVNEVNETPVAFGFAVTNAEDVVWPIVLDAADVDGPVTNFVVTVPPTHGSLTGTAPFLSYLPATNYFGPDSFIFTVNDGSLTSSVAMVSLIVTNVNDAPTLSVLPNLELGVYEPLAVTNLAADVDAAPGALVVQFTGPAGATLTNGVIRWMPTDGPQTNQFTTVVWDDGVPSLAATNVFNVSVTNAAWPPMILAVAPAAEGDLVTWTSISNAPYRLEFLDDLTGTNWTALPAEVAAHGPETTATNAPGGVPVRFYRVRLLP